MFTDPTLHSKILSICKCYMSVKVLEKRKKKTNQKPHHLVSEVTYVMCYF